MNIDADTVIRLVYRVEQNHLPEEPAGHWRPWSNTGYGTKADAVAARGRITAHFGVAEDHLRVIRVTVEVVG